MKICIITENFLIPWSPSDLSKSLGGSQEVVVYFAKNLSNLVETVDVYLKGPTKAKTEAYDSVKYFDFSLFSEEKYDKIILFKVHLNIPFSVFIPIPNHKVSLLEKLIYWSSDVETITTPYPIIVCLSEYHKNRLTCLEKSKKIVIPHGIDFTSLDRNKIQKESNTMLYSSSPDRGFFTLLQDWKKIKVMHPKMKLYVTYGYKILYQISGQDVKSLEKDLKNFCEEEGIIYLGNLHKDEMEKLYWKCEYWILPLNNPDSELFCLNAVKSAYCGCKIICNKIGALTETVKNYIDYKDFIKGEIKERIEENSFSLSSCSLFWEDVLKIWKPIISETI